MVGMGMETHFSPYHVVGVGQAGGMLWKQWAVFPPDPPTGLTHRDLDWLPWGVGDAGDVCLFWTRF